jgi:predicted nucleotidyltransferase
LFRFIRLVRPSWRDRVPASPSSYFAQPLDRILARPGALRILRVLARHGGLLAAPLLAARARVTHAGTLRALAHLETTGVVTREGSGRSVLYRLSLEHMLAGALRDLFDREAERHERVLDAIRGVTAEIPGLQAVWLYGSAARGDDSPGSDLDIIAVSSEPSRDWVDDVTQNLRATELMAGVHVSLLGLSTEHWSAMSPSFRDNIVAEAIPLVGPHPAHFPAAQATRKRQRRRTNAPA